MQGTTCVRLNPLLSRVVNIRNELCMKPKKHVLIDYSSPNIAKPFHFGHLKSTILGNFLANVNKFYGNDVTRINYIGDWGTQYGLLSLGLDECSDHSNYANLDDQSKLEYLVDIYVKANDRGKADENFYSRARERFHSIDKDPSSEHYSLWEDVRNLSLDQLKKSYELLGIHFDVYEFESDYADASKNLIVELQKKGLIRQKGGSELETSKSFWVADIMKNGKPVEVPLLKSDGSSLYITRDIAAAISRKSNYDYDQLLYVVGANQENHFHSLREIVKQLTGSTWSEQLIHVKMGKVIGMNSRSGNYILLSKIVDEAIKQFKESTKNTPTSKAVTNEDVDYVAKHLALTSLFVSDMRNRRTRNYEFDWNQVMSTGDRTGIQIQTTYARLCSLVRKTSEVRGIKPSQSLDEIDYSAASLKTDLTTDALELISCLNDLRAHIELAYDSMDPYHILKYTFKLCKLTNRARNNDLLQVVKEPNDKIAKSRLELFNVPREQLKFIIELLGLKALERV